MIKVFVSADEIATIELIPQPGDIRKTPGWEERAWAAGIDPKRYVLVMRDLAIRIALRDQGYPIDREGWTVQWWETKEDSDTGLGRYYRMNGMS